jgi:hypothetical protein
MQVVTEVGPHSSPELVPIAATPEPRSSSPAVPSLCSAGPRWGRERSATPGHQRTTAVNRRPGQSACQTIAAGPRTGLPALLRQRFGVRVPGGAPPSAPVRPGMPPGFSFGRLARARMGPAEGPKRPRLELQDRPSAAPCSPTACMASSRSRSSASWPSNRWPQRSSVNDTDVCPARTATSFGVGAGGDPEGNRRVAKLMGPKRLQASGADSGQPHLRSKVRGPQHATRLGGEHVGIGRADRSHVGGQLLDHRPREPDRAPSSPGLGRAVADAPADVTH